MPMLKILVISMFILIIYSLMLPLNAEVPQKINYQGRLTNDAGEPITGSVLINFKIYNDNETGDLLWLSGPQPIQVTDGLFSYELGSAEPIPYNIFHENQLYLSLTVGSDPEMSRTQLITVPYAFNAVFADSTYPDDDWSFLGNNINHSPGNVGIGVSSPTEPLVVGSDLGMSYEGNYIVSGAPLIDFTCGYKLGLNNDSHATLEWYGDGPPLAIHTKENGTAFNNTLVVKGGNVGIGNTWPLERLSIGPNLGEYWGEFITICGNEKVAGMMFGQGTGNFGSIYRGSSGIIQLHNYKDGTAYPGLTLDSAKVGLLSYTPTAAVSIGSNVGNYYGNWLTIGDSITSETGIIFGENENNNCSIARSGAGKVQINTKDAGVFYNGINLYKGRVGIGLSAGASEKLVIGKDLGSYAGEMIVVGNDDAGKYSGIKLGEDSDYNGSMAWSNDNDYLYFVTITDGVSATPLVLKGWNLGLGTSNPGERLHVIGNICYTGSIGACSDVRYKRNIHTLEDALDKVTNLRGVSFEWKKDEFPDQKFNDNEQIGLVAQEVKDIVPQVVSETNDGYYNVDYSKLTALLVEAVKELKAENEELRTRIDKLEGR